MGQPGLPTLTEWGWWLLPQMQNSPLRSCYWFTFSYGKIQLTFQIVLVCVVRLYCWTQGRPPHPQRGACGTETRVSLPAKNFHPWRRPALSPRSQPLCSVLSPAAGQKRYHRKLWWFSSFQPWLDGGSGLLPVQLWRNWAEMEDKHVPHQSSLCRCCPHDPAANKR